MLDNNNKLMTLWQTGSLAIVGLVIVSFSTDIRFGITMRLGSKPDFQCFELATLLLGLIFILGLPYLITNSKLSLSQENLFLALFIFNAFITAIMAKEPTHSISRAKDFLVCGFLYAFLRYGPFNNKKLDKLVYLIIGIGFLWALLGLLQWLGLDSDYGGDIYKLFLASQAIKTKSVVDVSTGDVLHTSFAHGLYLYPQNFVYYLIFPFALSIGFSFHKTLMLIIPIVIFTAMIGTLSKTFILLLSLFILIYFSYRLFRSISVTIITLSMVFILIVFLIIFFGDSSFWLKSLGTFIWRTEIWRDTLTMLTENPLLLITGHGTELLRDIYSRENYPNPHNMILYFLIEYGVIGVTLFASFIYIVFRKLAVCLFTTKQTNKPHITFLFIGIFFFLCMGIVDDIFVQTQLDGLFFFYLGILMKFCDNIANTSLNGNEIGLSL